MRTFYIRAASAFVFAIAMIGGILWNSYTFLALMVIILVGTLNEYFTIIAPQSRAGKFKWFVIIVYTSIFLSAYTSFANASAGKNWLGILIAVGVFIVFISVLFNKVPNPFDDLGWKLIPIFWMLIPMMLSCKIYFERGGFFLLTILAVIWIYDTGCYIVGSLIGRRKLFERVSPKKTWEGLIGGIIISLSVVYFVNRLPVPSLAMFTPGQWLLFGFVITVASTFGDLVESLLKRNLGIKDSGNMLPGHGGFLDRFDSFYFAIPFVELTIRIVEKLNM